MLWPYPLLDLVCFILASKKERGCYNPCGGFYWVRYSQIAGGMSYQLMPGFILGLHDLCTFRNGWTTGSTKGRKNFYHPIPNTHGLLPAQWIVNSCTSDRQWTPLLKGDYRRPHSVSVGPYSLCPGISKQARQGLSLDNMGRNKPDRCYLFTCGHFTRTRISIQLEILNMSVSAYPSP